MGHKPNSKSIWSFPALRFPSFFDELEQQWLEPFSESTGLSVSEDEKKVYIEAALPGVKLSDIETNFEKGILWIKGQIKEETEDKNKKYYHKSAGSFSYRVAVPGTVDETVAPEAVYKNGILKISFLKTKKTEPKKIQIKEE